MIKCKIDGLSLTVPKGTTIYEAAKKRGIVIPTLYYMKGIIDADMSGVSVVEVEGSGMFDATITQVTEGMVVYTETPAVIGARTAALTTIMEKHDYDCFHCIRTGNCELQELASQYYIGNGKPVPTKEFEEVDCSNGIIIRNNNKCIGCGRCASICSRVQGVEALETTGAGVDVSIRACGNGELKSTNCVNCGQCVAACPVGALMAKDVVQEVLDDIKSPMKFVIAQTAPAVRAALGEEFDYLKGVDVEGRMAGALKALGFDRVFDTKLGADMTVMEEANELIFRIQKGGALPMFTSCCPGWVKYLETFYPEMIPNLSSCKSPHQMFGAICKSYYAEKLGIPKEHIVTVSIMPCTAKKFEITRKDENGAGVPDVDYVLTTRELGRMLKRQNVEFDLIPVDTQFDDPLGMGTGAGVIFGATGGVMEAALRTAAEMLSGKNSEKLEFTEVRGMEGIKEANYEVAGVAIKVAVCSGLMQAKSLLEKIQAGEANYHFVEVMACPGGCVNGGGQPHWLNKERAKADMKQVRAAALYKNDEMAAIRKSHENPVLKKLYEEYLGEPGSELAHKLLHTSYQARKKI